MASSNEQNSTETAKQVYGYDLDVVRSALQKAIRRGQEDAAAWWAWCLIHAGRVRYLWGVLSMIASEDVGAADSTAAVTVDALARNAERSTDGFTRTAFVGVGEMHAVLVLCRAKKDWQATHLLLRQKRKGMQIERGQPAPEVPPEALDAHTRAGRRAGVKRTQWYAEGDALQPKGEGHHSLGGDPFADVHGDEELV